MTLDRFRKYLLEKRGIANHTESQAGYDWAAGKLLRQEMTPAEVRVFCDRKMFDDSHSYFDAGALQAAAEFASLTGDAT